MTVDRAAVAAVFADWAAPGRSAFRWAAVAAVVGTAGSIVQWAAIALAAQDAIQARGVTAGPLVLIAAAMLILLGARFVESEMAERGRRRVALSLRRRALVGLLPDGPVQDVLQTPASASTLLLDSVDTVADYIASREPLHRSLPWAMGMILCVTAVLCWPVAVLLVVATTLLPLNLRIAGLAAEREAERQHDHENSVSELLLDGISGASVLHTFRAARRYRERVDAAGRTLDLQTRHVLRVAFLSAVVMDVVITFSIAVAATFVGFDLLGYLPPAVPRMSLFTGLTVLTLCPLYFVPVRRLGAVYHARDTAAVAAGRILRLPAPTSRHTSPVTFAPQMDLEDVVVGYSDGEVLLQIQRLTVAAGRWTAITGPSGSGKTSLLSTLSGLSSPMAGRVTWSDDDETRAPEPGMAAWIGQHGGVLTGTVADNLRLGSSDASDAELRGVLRMVGLGDLSTSEDGLLTRVGAGGRAFSSGEGRRLAIARAMLRGGGAWVLDEPTAHLDEAAAADVVTALRLATAGCTVVVASHDEHLISQCDDVVRIGDGAVTSMRARVGAA